MNSHGVFGLEVSENTKPRVFSFVTLHERVCGFRGHPLGVCGFLDHPFGMISVFGIIKSQDKGLIIREIKIMHNTRWYAVTI